MVLLSNIIWIAQNIESEENIANLKLLESLGNFKVKSFKSIKESMIQIKSIQFEETFIIISGELYIEFIDSLQRNLVDINVIPKIIIFTENKSNFLNNNEKYMNIINHKFYNYGGIKTSFEEIQNFILNKPKNKLSLNQKDSENLIFEYIDNKEQLILPLLYKVLMEVAPNDKIEEFTRYLNDKYSNKSLDIKILLNSINNMKDIPLELLSKYYSRIYTNEDSYFYEELNKDLKENKANIYLPYIKVLYEGIKLKSLPLAANNNLYRGSILSNNKIKEIKNYLKNKIEGLPGAIVFSRTFLSFTKDEKIANSFLSFIDNNNNDLSKVLFEVEKDNNIDYTLSTHADIEKISYLPDEKEVLFFPFSSFEIQDMQEINNNNEKIYLIKLLYLGKYFQALKNDINLNKKEETITDSKFKNEIIKFGLINKENIENNNINLLFRKYDEYKENINNNINKCNPNLNDNNNKNKSNEINCIYKVENNEDEIYLLQDYSTERISDDEAEKSYFEAKKINKGFYEKYVELFINGNKKEFDYIYNASEGKEINVKFKFKKNLTKMNYMFAGCSSLKSIDFSSFNASNVTNMSGMFCSCSSLESVNFSSFNTNNVVNMNSMFQNCSSLKSIDLSSFNTNNVTNMSHMFMRCSSLNSLDLSSFNTSNVTDMFWMFRECSSLKFINLSSFNTTNVTKIKQMFYNCSSLKSLNLSSFNQNKVTDMSEMFHGCSSLESINLSSFYTINVIDMSDMFEECTSLNTLDLSSFNTSKVTNMSGMFNNCSSLNSINLSSFNTSNVNDMSKMFLGCSSLKSIDLSSFNTCNVTKMNIMFSGCSSLKSIDISPFNTSNVTEMCGMFSGCSSLKTIDLSTFNTSNVTNLSYMFCECTSLNSLDLSSFNTSNVSNTGCMFSHCSSLNSLDLSSFNTSNVSNTSLMFYCCKCLNKSNIKTNNDKILEEFNIKDKI